MHAIFSRLSPIRNLAAMLAVLVVCGIQPAAAANLDEAERAEIRQIISQQLAAFRIDDAETTYGFASATIQAKFGDPATFLFMVRTYYDPVYRPQSFEFTELLQQDGEIVQTVLIIDRRGRAVVAVYSM